VASGEWVVDGVDKVDVVDGVDVSVGGGGGGGDGGGGVVVLLKVRRVIEGENARCGGRRKKFFR
jgi:hypothetical protein